MPIQPSLFFVPDDNSVPPESTQNSQEFDLHTGQECDVLVKGTGHGKSGTNWFNEPQRGVRVWEEKGASHRLELFQTQDKGADLTFEALEQLTQMQSIDSAFAFFYVCGVLSPPGEEQRSLVGGFIDLNDVMQKIGWLRDKPDAATRDERRAKIWDFLRFFASARVVGERSMSYRDPTTGEIIPTRIEAAPWTLDSPERPDGGDPKAAPVRVRVVISSAWTPLLTSPSLTQFMPLGEVLGAIPSGKPSGDWARTIGLTLSRLWRIKPRETKARTYCPTRRQLLTVYTPKTQTVEEVLASNDPKRAVDYYCDALRFLVEGGFIAPEGDAAPDVTADSMLEPYNRQGWADKWLDASSGIFPGAGWQHTIEERAAALPPIKPKNLRAKGRPRKRF